MPRPPRRRGASDGATAMAPAGVQALSTLPGVGPKVAEKFAARGLLSVQDLWLHLPLRYEDRTRITPIAALFPGQSAQVEARVEAVERSFRYRPTLRVAIADGSRGTLVLRFFHFNRAQLALFVPGRRILCFGEARPGQYGLEMVHPSYRLLGDDADAGVRDRLDPVYPAVEGLGPQSLSRRIGEALDPRAPGAARGLRR
ncbi:MAG: ATP-dependent DNA helicase RecG, partial [Arenimonas sp.]|nr:ATP-dependent DNA helicase RecG [Arenimonas sp.]